MLDIFYAKVVNNKGKGDITHCVAPQARSDGDRSIAVGGKNFLELVVCMFFGLGETIHALADFDIDVLVVNEGA